MRRNEAMRSAKEESAAARLRFLQPHAHILAKFGAKMPSAAASAADGGADGGAGFVEDPAIMPPKEIQVEMREYQKRGLRWLAAMHASGVNAILADEMGEIKPPRCHRHGAAEPALPSHHAPITTRHHHALYHALHPHRLATPSPRYALTSLRPHLARPRQNAPDDRLPRVSQIRARRARTSPRHLPALRPLLLDDRTQVSALCGFWPPPPPLAPFEALPSPSPRLASPRLASPRLASPRLASPRLHTLPWLYSSHYGSSSPR